MVRRVALLGLFVALATGCHESEIEPRSPLGDDWARGQWQEPVSLLSQADIPSADATNPAPALYRAPSVSLGFVGDEPLTPTPSQGPRWPWVQEPFRVQPSYAYGYGYARRAHRR